jgi:hypothetical protein
MKSFFKLGLVFLLIFIVSVKSQAGILISEGSKIALQRGNYIIKHYK